MSKISFLIFHNFVKKISSKWSVKTFVSIVIFLVKMAPKNEKIKENPPRKGKWRWTITGPLLAKVYRCYSTCGYLEASKEKLEIWNKKSHFCRSQLHLAPVELKP